MQVQFLDQLIELTKLPEMKGVEVLLVGDHAPPAFDSKTYELIKFQKASFIHFKVKE